MYIRHCSETTSQMLATLIRVMSKLCRIRISADYRLIEVNIDVAMESYTTGCNRKDIAT